MPLQLTAMTLRGVGSYIHGSRLEVRPLTILSGVNGAGKSTWFKSLQLLRRSVEKRLLPFAFDTDDSNPYDVRFMNYSLYCSNVSTDLRTGTSEETDFGPPACIGLEFVASEDLRLGEPVAGVPVRLNPISQFLSGGTCPKGTKLKIKIAHPTGDYLSWTGQEIAGMHHLVELSINGATFSYQKPHESDMLNKDQRHYRQFQTSPLMAELSEGDLRQLVATRIRELMQVFFEGYFHISAVRSLPDMENVKDSPNLSDAPQSRSVGPDGQRTFDVHFWNTVKRQPYHSADFPDVNQVKGVDQFVHDSLFNLLGTSVEPDELVEEGELNRFTNDYLIGPQYPRQFSSGFHQLLPIIVQSALMDPGETLSIENPEVHLHPDLQLKVSEFLLQQSRTGRQILIETHSDLMIRRIVRAMLAEEDGLSQQHVSLNFSSPRKGDHGTGSVLHQFGVDSSGRIEWPDGFMDASINESQRMMDVMYGRRSSPHTEGNE